LQSCIDCVSDVINSDKPEPHINCEAAFSSTDKAGCIAQMPDCFWVREVDPNYDAHYSAGSTITERCVNDYDLKDLKDPAYIMTS
jgi:hypothetical protein